MDKYQKETFLYSLKEEKKILNELKKQYTESKKGVLKKIKELMNRTDVDLPHVIHQIKYQKMILLQLDEVLKKLENGQYTTISDYLNESYENGFLGTMYSIQKQGVPLVFPISRNEILRAVETNSKLSTKLYNKLHIDLNDMKRTVMEEVTRGVSSSMSYADVARNINQRMNTGLKRAYRIARTESHRIGQEASFDAMTKTKNAGAEIVKQWDSTLDGRTRPHHRQLNGQIRELDEPFEVAGLKAMYPSGFGRASEDINCRCVVLEIARWELDEDETFSKFDGNKGVIVKNLSNAKNFNDFKTRYKEG